MKFKRNENTKIVWNLRLRGNMLKNFKMFWTKIVSGFWKIRKNVLQSAYYHPTPGYFINVLEILETYLDARKNCLSFLLLYFRQASL